MMQKMMTGLQSAKKGVQSAVKAATTDSPRIAAFKKEYKQQQVEKKWERVSRLKSIDQEGVDRKAKVESVYNTIKSQMKELFTHLTKHGQATPPADDDMKLQELVPKDKLNTEIENDVKAKKQSYATEERKSSPEQILAEYNAALDTLRKIGLTGPEKVYLSSIGYLTVISNL